MELAEASKALDELAREIPRGVVIRAMNIVAPEARRAAEAALAETTLGKVLAGQRVAGKKPGRTKKRGRLRASVTPYTQGETSLHLAAYALAAMLEQGGTTKAHSIVPTTRRDAQGKGGVLAFNGAYVSKVVAPPHPGSRLPATRLLSTLMDEQVAPRLREEVDRSLQQTADGLLYQRGGAWRL